MIRSKQGFSLLEILVTVAIIVALAAIAIPIIAGVINKSNKSADETNISEINKAIEQFVSEYEIYHNDISEERVDLENLNTTQSRVFNTLNIDSKKDIELIESEGYEGKKLNKNTKYPLNYKTIKAVINNYLKTSTKILVPNQTNMHYWYSPDCGIVICDKPTKTVEELNTNIKTNLDSNGNKLSKDTVWIDITDGKFVKFDMKYKSGFLKTDDNKLFKVVLQFHRDGSGRFITEIYDDNEELTDTKINEYLLGSFEYKEGKIINEGTTFARVLENGEGLLQEGTAYGDVILYLND